VRGEGFSVAEMKRGSVGIHYLSDLAGFGSLGSAGCHAPGLPAGAPEPLGALYGELIESTERGCVSKE